LLFLLLYHVYRRNASQHGIVTALYFLGYALIRFFLEPLRGDPRLQVGFFTIGQFISLILFAAGVMLLCWRQRHPTMPLPPPAIPS
jgi:phosphatidylglycerol:prolipoprotein diacylglycerol transferase